MQRRSPAPASAISVTQVRIPTSGPLAPHTKSYSQTARVHFRRVRLAGTAMTSDDDRPRRRFLDQPGGQPTLVGDGGHFEGTLRIPGPLTVGGTVVATGEVGGVLTIGRTGRWQGKVHAHAAVILGVLHGELRVDTKLELGSTAVIHGSVTAGVVAIADGAVVDGAITVTGGVPPVRFTDRRRGKPADEPGAG